MSCPCLPVCVSVSKVLHCPRAERESAPEVVQRAQHALQVGGRELRAQWPRIHAQHEALADQGAEAAAAETHARQPPVDWDADDYLLD